MARSVRVLWIDHSPTDIAPALQYLEQAGYSIIHELIQKPEALKSALYANEWDLAICANDLPDFNPLTAIQLIQQTKCPPAFIVLDRTGSEAQAVQLLNAGAATCLTTSQLGRLTPLVQRLVSTTRTAADQTDRLKRELFLRESQFQRLFDNPGIAICELDFSALDIYLKEQRAAGIGDFKIFFDMFPDEVDACARKIKILGFNQRCISLLEFKSKEDFLANFINNVFFETLQVFIENLIAFANGVRTIETEFPIRSCSGKTVFLACSMTIPKKDEGETARTIAFLTDITKRHQAEKALVESRDKLELLVDIIPVGISVLDINHTLVKANRTLEEFLGMSFEEMARGYNTRRRYFRPDGTRKPASEFASTRVYHGEERVYHVETGIEKEDGSLVWADVSAAAFPFSDWSTVMVTADITRRVETELQNQKLISEMRQLNSQQEAIIKFTSHLRESTSSQEAMQIFLQDALTIFSASFVTIILNENGGYHAYQQYSDQPERNEKCVLKDNPYFLEFQKKPGVRFNLDEQQLSRFILSTDLHHNLWERLPKNNVLVPILSEFEPAGFMVLGSNSRSGLNETQQDLLLSIATIAVYPPCGCAQWKLWKATAPAGPRNWKHFTMSSRSPVR